MSEIDDLRNEIAWLRETMWKMTKTIEAQGQAIKIMDDEICGLMVEIVRKLR